MINLCVKLGQAQRQMKNFLVGYYVKIDKGWLSTSMIFQMLLYVSLLCLSCHFPKLIYL